MKRVVRAFGRWLLDRRLGKIDNFTRRIAASLSNHVTANQLTLLGLAMCLPITIWYMHDVLLPASILVTISLLIDGADGPLAHYQQGDRPPMTFEEEQRMSLWRRINFRGVTHLGKALDPFKDKVLFLCILHSRGWGRVSGWLLIALTVLAVVLTFVRPIKRWLKMGDARANKIGRMKVWVEVIAICVLVLYPYNRTLTDSVFALALCFGVLSLGGHVLTGTAVRMTRAERRAARTAKRAAKREARRERRDSRALSRQGLPTDSRLP